jgi:hypothetical protein
MNGDFNWSMIRHRAKRSDVRSTHLARSSTPPSRSAYWRALSNSWFSRGTIVEHQLIIAVVLGCAVGYVAP